MTIIKCYTCSKSTIPICPFACILTYFYRTGTFPGCYQSKGSSCTLKQPRYSTCLDYPSHRQLRYLQRLAPSTIHLVLERRQVVYARHPAPWADPAQAEQTLDSSGSKLRFLERLAQPVLCPQPTCRLTRCPTAQMSPPPSYVHIFRVIV